MTDPNKIKEAYKIALTGPHGEIMLQDLMTEYVLSPNPYKDPEMVMRFEGRRDLVLAMLSMAYGDPEDAVGYLIKAKRPHAIK